MELPSIPEPEIKTNPITKSESVKLSKAEFDKIKQVIDYQQTQITSLEAQKSDLSAKLENVELILDTARKKPYMRENEALTQNLKKESNLSEELTKKYGALSNSTKTQKHGVTFQIYIFVSFWSLDISLYISVFLFLCKKKKNRVTSSVLLNVAFNLYFCLLELYQELFKSKYHKLPSFNFLCNSSIS